MDIFFKALQSKNACARISIKKKTNTESASKNQRLGDTVLPELGRIVSPKTPRLPLPAVMRAATVSGRGPDSCRGIKTIEAPNRPCGTFWMRKTGRRCVPVTWLGAVVDLAGGSCLLHPYPAECDHKSRRRLWGGGGGNVAYQRINRVGLDRVTLSTLRVCQP